MTIRLGKKADFSSKTYPSPTSWYYPTDKNIRPSMYVCSTGWRCRVPLVYQSFLVGRSQEEWEPGKAFVWARIPNPISDWWRWLWTGRITWVYERHTREVYLEAMKGKHS